MLNVLKNPAFTVASATLLSVFPVKAAEMEFDVVEATISDVYDAFSVGTLTSVDLTEIYLDRIEEYDDFYHSVPVINPNALEEAAELDQLWEQGMILGPLHGIPIVIKNSYNVEGLLTTNGVGIFKDKSLIAREDAFAVKKLKEAGAIILGKAAMSTWAFSYDGVSEAFGSVINPYAIDRTPGGSSSGSGVAVAANFAMLAMGGETGGSIRVPSTHNALVGLKPSAGLISVDGTWPLVPERDVIGPMAKSVDDIARAMDALVAYDPNNIWNPFLPDFSEVRSESYSSFLDEQALAGKVIGLPTHYIGKGDPEKGESFPLQPEVADAFDQAKTVLKDQGATLVEVDIPAHTTWFIDGPPEPYTDEVRQPRDLKARAYYYEQLIEGYNNDEITSFPDLLNLLSEDYEYYSWVESNANAILDGDIEPWIGEDGVDEDVAEALAVIERLRESEYEQFLLDQGIDALAFPTLNYLAPPRGDEASEVYDLYGSLPARFEANNLGLPAITVPMGYSEEGIPMSLEFLGNYLGEAEIIGYAYDYEQATQLRRAPAVPVSEPSTNIALIVGGISFTGWRFKSKLNAALARRLQ